jgi:hypothetical protein
MVTQIPESTRFYAPPVTKYRWLPAIAAATFVPVYAEWDAGTDLSDEVAEVNGFTVTDEAIATPGLSSFTGSVPGRTSVDRSSIAFYADLAGQDVRTVLDEGDEGFLCICPAGDAAGKLMSVFKTRLGAFGEPFPVTGSNAHQLIVPVHILRKPARDVVIPASA